MSRRRPPCNAPEASGDAGECARVALGLLARREHSRRELERKLASRGFAAEVTAEVLDGLERSGALAADRFTESFIRTRIARGQGPVRLRAELSSRGIAEELIAAALGAAEWDWEAAARRARIKRFGRPTPRDRVERAKQIRFLEYRGFAAAQIRAALDQAEEAD